jgi:hypothetical protein
VVDGEDSVKATASGPCRSATRRIAAAVSSSAASRNAERAIGVKALGGGEFGHGVSLPIGGSGSGIRGGA